MSDLGRKDFTTQAKEGLTPDSQKSTLEKTKETITGAGDRAAGAAQPNDSKSAGQSMGDTMRGGKDDASNQGGSMMDSASNTLSNAADSVSNALGGKQKK